MAIKNVQQAIGFMRTSLSGIYPHGEVEGFIRLIFEKLCGYTTTQLLLYRDSELSSDVVQQIEHITQRLLAQEPIQYILGEAYFGELCMSVGPGVLIPRPETAEIVQRIIARQGDVQGRVADLCTGSGCIAIALSLAWKNAQVEGWDISPQALAYARRNAESHGVDVMWRECDVLQYEPSQPRYEVMVSNPPYIMDSERVTMDDNVLLYEPHTALFVADDTPLLFYNAIADIAMQELLPGGALYFEINSAMGDACSKMLKEKGFEQVEVYRDYLEANRMVRCVKV
jgi:release factor glutamine methyltransferase